MSWRDIVEQIAKHFATQLNIALDDLGIPKASRDRSAILGKMLDIPKQQAWSLLEGQVVPDESLLQRIAAELEIEPDELLGREKASNT
jgi:transcriptional regulator with XRE-family HTH domain